MNIFAIEGQNNKIDWIKSAQSQDNYRVIKMSLESCQMLCTTLNEQVGKQLHLIALHIKTTRQQNGFELHQQILKLWWNTRWQC